MYNRRDQVPEGGLVAPVQSKFTTTNNIQITACLETGNKMTSTFLNTSVSTDRFEHNFRRTNVEARSDQVSQLSRSAGKDDTQISQWQARYRIPHAHRSEKQMPQTDIAL